MAVRGSRFRRFVKRTLLHGALALGSVVFSLPFLWLLSTSAKEEREVFVWPPEPMPRVPESVGASPWIDRQAFRPPRRPEGMSGAEWKDKGFVIVEALESETSRMLSERNSGSSLPPEAIVEIAQGVWAQTALRIPEETWKSEPEEIARNLAATVTESGLNEIADEVRRRLIFGDVRLGSWAIDRELVSGEGANNGWRFADDGSVSMTDIVDAGKDGLLVDYRVSEDEKIVFTNEFALPFDPSEFKRVIFAYRGDASWNVMACVVEFEGKRFETKRPLYIRQGSWVQTKFQFASAEDSTRTQRKWRVLHPVESEAAFSDPGKVQVAILVERQSNFKRVAGKFSENYREAQNYMPFWRYTLNSTILVTLNIIAELLGCSLVAFAFARLRWPGRGFCFVLVLSTLMVPQQVLMIPRFLIYRQLGWYNTWLPLWVPSLFGSAFFIFLLTQFMRGIPTDLEDSAKIDGCGYFRIYWNLILPLTKPALAAIAIFTFMGVWNDFMRPLIYLADQRDYPLSLGLYALHTFFGQSGTGPGRQGIMMAASMMMTVPVIALFFAAQRYFIQGVTLTGMKN